MKGEERDTLIEAFCAGTIDEAGARRLLAVVQDDPHQRRELVEQVRAHLGLIAAHAAPAATAEAITARLPGRRRAPWSAIAGVAAAALLLAVIGWWALARDSDSTVELAEGRVVTLTDGRTTLTDLPPATVLRATDDLRLVTGDGTVVRVAADSVFSSPDTERLWHLHTGRLEVRAAAPLRVRTPQAEAAVLGTRFRLAHDAEATRLHVEAGRVRFATHAGETVVVTAGETATASDGEVVHSAATSGAELLRYQRYDAARGIVVDEIGDNHLLVRDATALAALPAGGFVIEEPTRLDSRHSIADLLPALRAADGMTLEAWLRPARLDLTGPSRMFACSGGRWSANFVLGLGGDHPNEDFCWGWRLSTENDEASGRPTRTTKRGLMREGWVHVVLTVAEGGEEILYVDGEPVQRQAVGAVFSAWDASMPLRVGDEKDGREPWERPYLGGIGLLSLRAGALSPRLVRHRFLVGRDRFGEGAARP